MDNQDKRLQNLDSTDYKVESDNPDIRGWSVKGSDNRKVGKVDNLLVNTEREKVVYVDVDVDESIIEEGHEPLNKPDEKGTHEFINSEGEDHLIIPIGMTALNEDEQCLRCDDISYDTFAKTKRYKKGEPIDTKYERYVVDRYDDIDDWNEDVDDENFYNSRAFQISEYRIG